MKILLINPNRFHAPPVPPIGLEYITGHLIQSGQAVEVLDLCFSKNIYQDLDMVLNSSEPDIAGITIRNIDSALYHHNEFFLSEIREIVHHIKSEYNLKVMIGGSGVSVDPDGILNYVNADAAFVGPAEHSLTLALDEIMASGGEKKIIQCASAPSVSCFRSSDRIDYSRYFEHNGIAGFETHKGCSSSCVYCIEANSQVYYKQIGGVIQEIRDMASRGYDHFHLCDPEFNEDPGHALAFCESLKKLGPPITWTAYMKPGRCSEHLFRLMRDTGVYLITLTVDSFQRDSRYRTDVEQFISLAQSAGIAVAVDFLTGFPYEDDETLKGFLDLFRACTPDSVNINTYIRLYKPLRITSVIRNDPALKRNLTGEVHDSSFLQPVFYNQVSPERLEELIGNDPLFRVDGLDKKVNYCRSSGSSGISSPEH